MQAVTGRSDLLQHSIEILKININVVDEKRYNCTALMYAATFGRYNAVLFLLDKGATPDIANIEGHNALTLTMRNIDNKNSSDRQGRFDSIALLISKGVKIDLNIPRHREALQHFKEHTTEEEYEHCLSGVSIEAQRVVPAKKELSWAEYIAERFPGCSMFCGGNNTENKKAPAQEMHRLEKKKN
jgi:hypothetical protein